MSAQLRETHNWHTQDVRPLSRADVGRFVVGHGLVGGVCGYVEVIHGDYLVVDTGRNGGPMNGYIVADVIQTYTFMEAPPDWVNSSFHQIAYGA